MLERIKNIFSRPAAAPAVAASAVAASAAPAGESKPRPLTYEVITIKLQDRWSSYSAAALTPAKVAGVIRNLKRGQVTEYFDILDDIYDLDSRIGAGLLQRCLAVAGLAWDVLPPLGADEEDPGIQAQVKFAANAISSIPHFHQTLNELNDAVYRGLAIGELLWAIRDGQAVVERIEIRPPRKFILDKNEDLKIFNAKDLEGDPIPEHKFILHTVTRQGSLLRAGLGIKLLWLYLFKSWTLKDWVSFAEAYGFPLRIGKYPNEATPEQIAVLTKAIISLATDMGCVIPQGMDISFQEAQRYGSVQVYDRLINLCNEEITIIITGQTLTTSTPAEGGGTRAQGQVHASVRQDYLEADCMNLQETLSYDLVRPIIIFNFGPQKAYPRFKLHFEPAEDLMQMANMLQILVGAGTKIPQSYVYERFNLPEPEPGEPVLERPAALPGLPMSVAASAGPWRPADVDQAYAEMRAAVLSEDQERLARARAKLAQTLKNRMLAADLTGRVAERQKLEEQK
ncbi:MAG: hypothetical protein A2V67_04910 [Deltaproteobacteria bacterium RBG_13_61_14]|nr:MAG: hypothetical protein A2V67_04910 [Deltaproteobacteria bacterium RBG_13_61_14]